MVVIVYKMYHNFLLYSCNPFERVLMLYFSGLEKEIKCLFEDVGSLMILHFTFSV